MCTGIHDKTLHIRYIHRYAVLYRSRSGLRSRSGAGTSGHQRRRRRQRRSTAAATAPTVARQAWVSTARAGRTGGGGSDPASGGGAGGGAGRLERHAGRARCPPHARAPAAPDQWGGDDEKCRTRRGRRRGGDVTCHATGTGVHHEGYGRARVRAGACAREGRGLGSARARLGHM